MAVAAGGQTPDFVRRFQAYEEVTDIDAFSSDGVNASKLARRDRDFLSEMPEEYRELARFAQKHSFAIAEEDEEILDELREKLLNVYKRMKSDVDENIWKLVDEGVEAESVEYLHSLITEGIENLIVILENNSLKEIEEKEEKAYPALKALGTAFQKLTLLLDEDSLSESEKRNANKMIIKLEENLREGEEFEKIDREVV